MATEGNGRPRPLLAGGEQLAHEAEKARGPSEKFHPQTYEQARQTLGPLVRGIRDEVGHLADAYRGDRVVVQAKLLPNYLAASYHPSDLRRHADLVMVG